MVAWARRIANSKRFQRLIIAVILVNAIVIGLETSRDIMESYGALFHWLDAAILGIFVFEIAVRLLAYWPRLLRFFRDGWNVFDFVIVVGAMLPFVGSFATVARLVRLLRVIRLVSIFPELRLIVGTMLRSISSMGHVLLLLTLVVYVYGVLGYYLFHDADPEHWGTLFTSFKTLFEMLTLEGWIDVQDAGLEISPYAWMFFASYVLLAVFIAVNLFIAVIINNLEAVKAEHQEAETQAIAETAHAQHQHHELLQHIKELKDNLTELEEALHRQERGPASADVQHEPEPEPLLRPSSTT